MSRTAPGRSDLRMAVRRSESGTERHTIARLSSVSTAGAASGSRGSAPSQDSGPTASVPTETPSARQPASNAIAEPERSAGSRSRRIAKLLLLRPTLFLESILAGLPFVEAMGVNADAVDPDVPIPMIATKDVAAAAVDALLSDEWHGVEVRELLGARDYTYSEATRILGAAIGRPDLQYEGYSGGCVEVQGDYG